MLVRVSLMALLLAAPAPPTLQPVVAQQTSMPLPPPSPQIAQAIAEWDRLRQSDSFGFAEYATFLTVHPGWPGESAMRRAAERALNPDTTEPRQVAGFFDRFPPLTNVGQARYADALAALGRNDEARAAARKAWTSGSLSTLDEGRLLAAFGSYFTPADQDERMDRLLWANSTTAAQRQLQLVSLNRRDLFAARLAMRTRAPDAEMLVAQTQAVGMSDAGYIADRALWLRATGRTAEAQALLAAPRRLTTRPADPEKWYETLLSFTREAQDSGQYLTAWNIGRQVDDALPAGTIVRDQPYGMRDDYTSLVWRAGMIAFADLNRPADAIGMFQRYADGAKSPQSRTKGYYWAGRSAQAAGRDPLPYFTQAAAFADQFYGQLALERLGRPVPAPPALAAERPTPAERQAFLNREIVQAARWLGMNGRWQDQTQFVRTIANSVESPTEHALADDLSRGIGRPDLAVMVARAQRNDGRSDYVLVGFPQVPVPPANQPSWTMIHAIARQESQFDREIVSHAGARGLMQLMPATARETAGKIGVGFDATALTKDSGYNIQLGSAHFQRLLDYFGGSYPLAVAAYNAGQGNVNKWIRANGDPRDSSVDWTLWIEKIPFSETRNYVQRVLENAVVYDTLNPARQRQAANAPLSYYLGKGASGGL